VFPGYFRHNSRRFRQNQPAIAAADSSAYSHPMDQDRPLFGVLLMLGFCGLAPFGDSLAKLLGGQIPLAELVLVRFSLQALFLLPVIHLSGTSLRCSRRVFRLTAYRTFLHILGTTFMYSALLFLPLADAIAIAFVMPFIMLVLGKTVLKEEVGTRRIIASIVGFGGTLMVIQPSFATVGLPALLPVRWPLFSPCSCW